MLKLIVGAVVGVIGVLVAIVVLVKPVGPDASECFPREVDQDLAEAAARGDKEGVDAAIAAGADVNAVGRDGIRPLEWVGYKSKVGFEYLLELGADPNAFNDSGKCAVHYTLLYQDADWLRMVLEHGGDPNLRDRWEVAGIVSGDTALFSAASRGNQDFMKLLIDHGAEINVIDEDLGYSPLISAANSGYMPNVKWLLEQGADWRVRTTNGIGLAEAVLQYEYDPAKKPECAAAQQWILDFLEEQESISPRPRSARASSTVRTSAGLRRMHVGTERFPTHVRPASRVGGRSLLAVGLASPAHCEMITNPQPPTAAPPRKNLSEPLTRSRD
jgi:hypothetical protein